MHDEGPGRPIPPGFKLAVALIALLWIAALLILSRTHREQPSPESRAILPVHPAAIGLSHSSVPMRDWKTVSYYAPVDYPSLEVFHYYDERMTDQGWTLIGTPEPEWHVSRSEKGRRATMIARWASSNGLMQLDLVLDWEEPRPAGAGPRREAPMRVSATMQRTAVPLTGTQPRAAVLRAQGERPGADKQRAPFAGN